MPVSRRLLPLVYLAVAAGLNAQQPAVGGAAIVSSEFVAPTPPTASAHASTIVETPQGLVAAWFGGTREGAEDVGIWLARRVNGQWTAPVEVATGAHSDGRRFPCWNPVLFQMPDGSLRLFYKVGPAPARWWGMARTSRDAGRTWSDHERLSEGILGPIKNKPILLANGTIVSPSSTESADTPPRWRVHFELSTDQGRTWTVAGPRKTAGSEATPSTTPIEAIQPSLLIHPGGRLQAIGRTRASRLFETWSDDAGKTWTPLALLALPNPNAGIDAVTLRDGRQLVVYNHTTEGRTPLNVAISRDGKVWEPMLVLEREPGEYSYPAVIQTRDGLVHVTYTWQRRNIKHVVIKVS
jgi:predicted neuraminidase